MVNAETLTHKRCSSCRTLQPVAMFYKKMASPDGLQSYCVSCLRGVVRERRRAQMRTTPGTAGTRQGGRVCGRCLVWQPREAFGGGDKGNGFFSSMNTCCAPCRTITQREAVHRRRDCVASGQFDAWIEQYDSRCMCCFTPTAPGALCVDHDHRTGENRGLLCFKCNSGIGKLGDEPLRVQRAVAYLERGRHGQ